eukprot:gene26155-13985_t
MLSLLFLLAPVVRAADWIDIGCPGDNHTKCSYTNTAATDMVVELAFQAQDTNDAALLCTVHSSASSATGSVPSTVRRTSKPAFAEAPDGIDVCRFEAQTAQYDGRPCVFFLPPKASFSCTTSGTFYWMGTHGSVLAKQVTAPL